MGIELQIVHDKDGNIQPVKGTDNRINTSSRSNSRGAYNSRTNSNAFSMVWEDATSESGDVVLYWPNTNTQGKTLVISAAGLNASAVAEFQLLVVSGTPSGGTATTPFCGNQATPRVAAAEGAATAVTTPITGLTVVGIDDHAGVTAGGHEEFRTDDRLRIGEGGAIAIKMHLTASGPIRTWGVVFGYYE